MNQQGYQYVSRDSLKPVILSLSHGYALHFIYKLLAVLQVYNHLQIYCLIKASYSRSQRGKWENGSKPAQTSTLTPRDEQLLKHTFQPSRSGGTNILWRVPTSLWLCHGSQLLWITSQHKYPVMAFKDKVAYTGLPLPYHSICKCQILNNRRHCAFIGIYIWLLSTF